MKKQFNPPVRFVTAASLFDGHDAAINIIRRVLQQSGAEVIHLGHNRSVDEIIRTAIQEDVHAIAISSYQGGHLEFFKYLIDRLKEEQAEHIKVFGGGGGVIVPEEITELEAYGVTRIFSSDEGLRIGLQGMVDAMISEARNGNRRILQQTEPAHLDHNDQLLAKVLTQIENDPSSDRLDLLAPKEKVSTLIPVIGVTGTGGSGKSTITDELIRRFLNDHPDLHIAILAVDPTRRITGGALLGDRIRMNAIYGNVADRVYMRSFATRQFHRSVSEGLQRAITFLRAQAFDLIFLETAGIGQSDTEIVDLADISIYVMTQEFGAPTQLEKIGMLDLADLIVLNKFDKKGSQDALRDIRKQIQRNRGLWKEDLEALPVFPTVASHFNDPGVTNVYQSLLTILLERFSFRANDHTKRAFTFSSKGTNGYSVIPPRRQIYLGEIVDVYRKYLSKVKEQVDYARKWGQVTGVHQQLSVPVEREDEHLRERLEALASQWWGRMDTQSREILETWDEREKEYRNEALTYEVRGKDLSVPMFVETLSGSRLPRVAFPEIADPGERVRFGLLENLPGYFPYTAGVYPLKRTTEDPTRMFAGEGSPERTNRRFHLLSRGMPAKRLSTAFDSVTLYGFDPDEKPDIYGKIGNAGVSICTLDDMKKLFSGFDLCDPLTSVSMTINGPAPIVLALFMNTAIDQQVEKYLREHGHWETVAQSIRERLGNNQPQYVPFGPTGRTDGLPEGHSGEGLGLLGVSGAELVEWGVLEADIFQEIVSRTLRTVRGTVQADILKEDQAQNTCIFSTEFALRLMGDVQIYFVAHQIRNYYSISISGYHIAEAGANPITQLAFTLANGFTYVEYFLSRGLDIDDFAPNLSFFFSNGMDAEYAVLGRVARRIWAIVMRERYGASDRSQKLKYHIQTSGRSLHAREIQYNDIRTTLQALLAVYDNCNSLHTNAYDEAITTPTEESVRRALAIQLIINRELGFAKNENPLQGSHFIQELTRLVEEAVLREFEAINERGGVLGAMESMYQRGKIQDESLRYEQMKHEGTLPLVGVNTFTREEESVEESPSLVLMRSFEEEKTHQISNLRRFQERNTNRSHDAIEKLKRSAQKGDNLFEVLMETVRYCSLGQITRALFEVGGQYRRSM